MAHVPPRPTASKIGGSANGGSGSSSGQRAKSDDKQPGTFFLGRYRVVDEIGVGGMASVHLARMDGPGGFQKWVAIKRIHPHLVEDDQFVDMFLDEARIAAGINHANVAQVFDLGKDENTYWIAMEYLHGEPLREVMRRAEDRRAIVTPELAARICSDAAEGLHAAHELRNKNGQLLGLVHRDVTPHNLFLTYDGYTKVVDFGIAKVADRLSSTRAGTLKGKLAYMSPEQVRGAEVDRTTDIFALGVVLWELTTSQRLFRMDTDLDTLEKVQACVVPPPSSLVPDYPVELESVVMKALAKRKQDRFQTAREFSRALQNFLMRRGAFVGPEEVAQFVRQVFSDRIQKREAHLAWAAEVTSTINVDQLRAGQAALPGSAEDLSLVSYDSQGQKKPRRAAGAAAPPVSGPGSLPPGLAAPAAGGMAPAALRPTHPAITPPTASQQQQMAAASLMDDDEDVPTTVATRNDHEGGASRPPAPRPAAGMPAANVAGAYPHPGNYGQPAPYASGAYPAHGVNVDDRTGGLPSGTYPAGNSGMQDLGSTIAMPNNQQMQQQAERMRMQAQQHQQQYQQFYQQQHDQPGYNGQAQQFYGQQQNGPGVYPQQGPTAQFPALQPGMAPQSQIETALSLPRPDPAAVWLAQQEEAARRPQKRNTGVLAAVVILTALCVTGIGALVYFKLKAAPPVPPPTPSAEATAVPAPPPPAPTPTEVVVPAPTFTATATATATAAPAPKLPPTPQSTAQTQPAPQTPKEPATPKEPPKEEPAATDKEEPGFLTIVCNPFCDEIQDGGRSLGPSPVVHVAVKPGQHRVTLKRKDFPTKVISVIVVSGQVTTQRVNMK